MTNEIAIAEKIARIQELPELIAKAQGNANHKEEMEMLVNRLKQKKLEFIATAGIKIDPDTQKKAFPNEKLREQFAVESMEKSIFCTDATKRLKELEKQKFQATIALDELRNEMSALKAVIPILREFMREENIKNAASEKTVRVEVHHVTG